MSDEQLAQLKQPNTDEHRAAYSAFRRTAYNTVLYSLKIDATFCASLHSRLSY
jgi:hypothetical protein